MSGTQPTIATLENAVELACHAPSIHNSQPWRWVLQQNCLQLHLDADRLVATDRSGREALLSCGAVLDHLTVALAAARWFTHIERYPNPNNHHHLATIGFSPMSYVTAAHRDRADAILRRRTDRLPFGAPPDWGLGEKIIRRAVDPNVASLDVVHDDDRPLLAEASHLTEALRQYDADYHAELDWWTGPFGDSDGIPHSSLVSAAESDRVDIGRTFPVTRHHAERRRCVPEDKSKVLVLSALGDTRHDVLRCGEALSQVLLKATTMDLATCTLTHMIELDVSRGIITEIVHRDFPQALVRVGAAPPSEDIPTPTPRRRLVDVLELRL